MHKCDMIRLFNKIKKWKFLWILKRTIFFPLMHLCTALSFVDGRSHMWQIFEPYANRASNSQSDFTMMKDYVALHNNLKWVFSVSKDDRRLRMLEFITVIVNIVKNNFGKTRRLLKSAITQSNQSVFSKYFINERNEMK